MGRGEEKRTHDRVQVNSDPKRSQSSHPFEHIVRSGFLESTLRTRRTRVQLAPESGRSESADGAGAKGSLCLSEFWKKGKGERTARTRRLSILRLERVVEEER